MEKAGLEIPQYGVDSDNTSPNHSNGAEREGLPPQKEGSAKTTQYSKQSTKKPDEDDVRELMREAYSKSTLHTFKSDPLKKRALKGEVGKGQPNMKLRMNALLAKIKRDCA